MAYKKEGLQRIGVTLVFPLTSKDHQRLLSCHLSHSGTDVWSVTSYRRVLMAPEVLYG